MNKQILWSLFNLKKINWLPAAIFQIFFIFTSITLFAQNKRNTVNGVVTNAQNSSPLPGVTVQLKGTTTGTTTDANGKYKIAVLALNTDTLEFSSIGFIAQNIAIDGRNQIKVALQPSVTQGKGIVVTAFGEQKEKEDVVGSVTSMDAYQLEKLQTTPSSNLTASLAGRVAGLIAYQRSGEPGADNANFFVRGVTTFGYNKNPLILIDNIESTPTDLARLNPSDIESFSILKDATATSLYGSRAANGVLLITTKEGHEGKAIVKLRLSNSISMPTQTIKLADPVTYMKLADQATVGRDPLAPIPYLYSKIQKTAEGSDPFLYPAVNWMDELFKSYTMNQRATLNINGGGNVAQYYVSGAFSQDHGVLKVNPINNFNNNIDLKSYSLRTNVNVNITNSTELAIKLSGNFDDYTGPPHSGAQVYEEVMVSSPVRFPPVYPVDSLHAHVHHPLFGNYQDPGGGFMLNPYAEMVSGYSQWNRSVMNAQISLKQDLSDIITKGLKLSGFINVQRYAYLAVTRSYSPYWYQASPVDAKGNYSLILLNEDDGTEYLGYTPTNKTVTSSAFLQAQVNYQHTFNEKNNIDGMVVFTARNMNPDHASNLQASLPHRNVNLASRVTYNYDHRYILEGNIGANSSERFSKNHRWGFFPSIGLAWNISNESFWKSVKPVISRLKARFSFGFSGNDNIGNGRFLYLSEVNLDDANRGFTTGSNASFSRDGISIARYANPKVTWERARKTNLGFDMNFFHHFDVTVDLYDQYRTQILEPRRYLSPFLGLDRSAAPEANTGRVKAKGIDLSLSYSQYFNNGLSLQIRGNLTYATNKIVAVSQYSYEDNPWLSRLGYSTSQQWGYIADRLFADEAEVENSPHQNFGDYTAGDIKYRDINDDGQITDLDKVPIGYPTSPELTYGFGFSVGYKEFDLSAFFQGLGNESFWIAASANTDIAGNNIGTAPFVGGHVLLKAYADDHWSEENQNLTALWPRLSTNPSKGIENNSQRNTWFMRNGKFLRLKGVEAGYSFPIEWIRRFSIQKFRLYVNGRNLMVWAPFKLWDPEMGGLGLGYPPQRVFNVGLEVVF